MKYKYDINSPEVLYLLNNPLDKDDLFKKIFQRIPEIELIIQEDIFKSLLETIISQQLSTKAAQAIINKFYQAFDNELNAYTILNTSDDTLRTIGLSINKIKYLRDLSLKLINNEVTPEDLNQMTNEEIITELIKIKGVGSWTAEMILIFSMHRLDVFSNKDLGLIQGLNYLLKRELPKNEIMDYVKAFSPYKTIFALFLWKYYNLIKNK